MKTKKDFKQIAELIQQLPEDKKESFIQLWSFRFAQSNSRFDVARFRAAAKGKLIDLEDQKLTVEILYKSAYKHAIIEVERIARHILSNHKSLNEFVMAMGRWFFTLKPHKKGERSEIIHDFDKDARFKEMKDFIMEWDPYFKLTGTPMRFTAKGKIIHNW